MVAFVLLAEPIAVERVMKAYPYLPGLVFAGICLVVLLLLVLPRLQSWYRGRHRPVLTPLQVEELLIGAGVLVVDLRSPGAFRQGHIRGSLHVPFDEVPKRFEIPDPAAKRAMVLVDETDALSHRALDLLTARGFTWIYVLKGGLRAWRSANRPLAR